MKRKSPVLLVILILLGMNLNAQTRFRDLIASHDNSHRFSIELGGLDYEFFYTYPPAKEDYISITVPQKRYPDTKVESRPIAGFIAGGDIEPHYDGDERRYLSIKDYNDLTPVIYELFDEDEIATLFKYRSSIWVGPIVSKDGAILDVSFVVKSHMKELLESDIEPYLELMKYYKENFRVEDGGYIEMYGEEYDRFSGFTIHFYTDEIHYYTYTYQYILEPWFDDEFFEQAKESGLDYHIEKYRKELTKEE